MLYSNKNHLRIIKKLLLINLVGFLILLPIVTPARADYVVIDWGDVVKMKVKIIYRVPGGADRFFSDGFLELYLGETIPSDVNETFDRLKTMSEVFRKRVIGMRQGEIRTFVVNYKEINITRPDHTLYGADITYNVEFLEMLLDAEYDPIFELTATHPVVIMVLIILGVFLFFLYYLEIPSIIFHQVQRVRTPHCSVCGTRTKMYCGYTGCNKPICRTCFTKEGRCPSCNRNKLVSKR
jgi:hypothetical protein